MSPYSVAAALSMVLAGARGLTSEQMAEVLHVALPGDRFHAARDALDRTIMDVEPIRPGLEGLESLRIDIANSLWAQAGYEFREYFLELLARHYGAGIRLVDYCSDPEGSRIAINNWVAEATKRRIIDLVPGGMINAMTRLVLVNAIYFKGNWLSPFPSGQTRPAEWRLLDGNHRTVPMMHTCRKYQFAEGDGWKAVRLAYHGERLDARAPSRHRPLR